jgi:hypothetical protein
MNERQRIGFHRLHLICCLQCYNKRTLVSDGMLKKSTDRFNWQINTLWKLE